MLEIKCHEQRGCGEWDYLDNLYIASNTEYGDFVDRVELLRYITPYGGGFRPDWAGFSWEADVTDYVSLLRDEVRLVYRHGGWEKSDRWRLSITFYMTEGAPSREFIDFDRVPWTGGTFEKADDPIEKRLRDFSFTVPAGAHTMRLKIHQTGHGGNDSGCAEFCKRKRTLTLDGAVFDDKILWNYCGYNPLHPQAGTWWLNRGGWCPGEIAWPDDYDFEVPPNSDHLLEMDMQAEPTGGKKARYELQALVFYYGKPTFSHDVALVDIVTPSKKPQYRRFNPSCGEPIVVIKNNGSEPLTSARIKYGLEGGGQTMLFNWEGNLAFMEEEIVRLPGVLDWQLADSPTTPLPFVAFVSRPNGRKDGYYHNNTARSLFIPPLVHKISDSYAKLKVVLETNENSSVENWYQLYDVTEGEAVAEDRTLPNSRPVAADLPLNEGHCYRFIFSDEGANVQLAPDLVSVPKGVRESPAAGIGDGFYTGLRGRVGDDTGEGSLRIGTDEAGSGANTVAFNGNFGSRITYYFVTSGLFELPESLTVLEEDIVDEPPSPYGSGDFGHDLLSLSPNPAVDGVEIRTAWPMEWLVVISMGGEMKHARAFEREVNAYYLSTEDLPKGIYVVKVNLRGQSVIRKLVVH